VPPQRELALQLPEQKLAPAVSVQPARAWPLRAKAQEGLPELILERARQVSRSVLPESEPRVSAHLVLLVSAQAEVLQRELLLASFAQLSPRHPSLLCRL